MVHRLQGWNETCKVYIEFNSFDKNGRLDLEYLAVLHLNSFTVLGFDLVLGCCCGLSKRENSLLMFFEAKFLQMLTLL